jgi:hypothetical protein
MFPKKKTADTPFVIFYYRNAVHLQWVHSGYFGGHAREFLLSTKSYINSTVLEHGFLIFSQQTYSYSLSVQFARRKTRDHVTLTPRHLQAAVSSHRRGPLKDKANGCIVVLPESCKSCHLRLWVQHDPEELGTHI